MVASTSFRDFPRIEKSDGAFDCVKLRVAIPRTINEAMARFIYRTYLNREKVGNLAPGSFGFGRLRV